MTARGNTSRSAAVRRSQLASGGRQILPRGRQMTLPRRTPPAASISLRKPYWRPALTFTWERASCSSGSTANSRNPRHFDRIEGGRLCQALHIDSKSVLDALRRVKKCFRHSISCLRHSPAFKKRVTGLGRVVRPHVLDHLPEGPGLLPGRRNAPMDGRESGSFPG